MDNKKHIKSKPLMRIRDAAEHTGLSISFIYKLTARHLLPYYKRGKFLYFSRCEINKWLKENRINPPKKNDKNDDEPGGIIIEWIFSDFR